MNREQLHSEFTPEHLSQLVATFVKDSVHNKLGVRLLHGHVRMNIGKIMVGQRILNPNGYHLQPRAVENVDVGNLQGRVFMSDSEDRLVAYEFIHGKESDLSSIASGFLIELTTFIGTNSLVGTVGL